MSRRKGPRLNINANCCHCEYCKISSNTVDNNSKLELAIVCSHPTWRAHAKNSRAGRYVGNTCKTPFSCPMLPSASELLLLSLLKSELEPFQWD